MLQGTPKRTIGDYAQRAGIPVPRRFATVQEALATGRPFILRSEHPIEYDGPSGIFTSHVVTPERIGESTRRVRDAGLDLPDLRAMDEKRLRQLKQEHGEFSELDILYARIATDDPGKFQEQLRAYDRLQRYVHRYCRLRNLSAESVLDGLTHTAWELLPGYNGTVIEDNAVPGRHHLFFHRANFKYSFNESFYNNYIIVENDTPRPVLSPEQLAPDVAAVVPQVIRMYERVRALQMFDQRHCPIVEFQWTDDTPYFLQYHRTRDKEPAAFRIEREPTADETPCEFVRGATPPEGMIVNVTTHYASWYQYEPKPSLDESQPQEEGVITGDPDWVLKETRVRDHRFYGIYGTLGTLAFKASCAYHIPKSILFKPRVSATIGNSPLLTEEEASSRMLIAKSGRDATIPLHVLSDGTRCYIRVVR